MIIYPVARQFTDWKVADAVAKEFDNSRITKLLDESNLKHDSMAALPEMFGDKHSNLVMIGYCYEDERDTLINTRLQVSFLKRNRSDYMFVASGPYPDWADLARNVPEVEKHFRSMHIADYLK